MPMKCRLDHEAREVGNTHSVSRIAYTRGVVITTFKGCSSQHLVAYDLGFTGGFQGKNETTTIEEYFADQEEEDQHVKRVTKEVFDLAQSKKLPGHSTP